MSKCKRSSKLLIETFKKESKILEVGCGSGRDAAYMIKNGYSIIATDGSKEMIEEAKNIHPELSKKLLYKSLPNDLNFEMKFDGIYSIATLMHLSENDLNKTISKIYNLLEHNGKFLISVSLSRDDINEEGFDNKGRFFLILTLENWINICESIGFRILYTYINKDGLQRDGIEWLTLVAQK
ncbi:class I SAM-dependent methyltransferase [Poseidonibacter lekithochrous]|nr:class I SAM-dependent methyltransferase [Poseidonibacter lekithochrous]